MDRETVLQRLVKRYPEAKKTTLREMVENRRVWINGAVVRSLKQELAAEDSLEIVDAMAAPPPRGRGTILEEGLRILHFDSEIIIVDKPAGLLTATDSSERRPTAWRILTAYFRRQNNKNQVHLIHRLDRDASGLLVFARTWEAYAALKKQFFEHTITREYDLIVHGTPPQKKGRLENLLLEDERTGVVRVTEDVKKGKLAILDYEVIGKNKIRKLAHVKCRLFTGRKHQIRVQMKAMGHPVCGDAVYGKPGAAEEPPGRLALHASHLGFAHPRGERLVKFDSPMPGSFGHLMR
jgi:23S rRNA pseudouridine1911/1915/1917 synthase